MTETILLKLFIIQDCVSSWPDFGGPSLLTLFFRLLTSPSTEKKLVLLLNKISSFLEFIFNWRIIALQYCTGFCHTSTCISHRYRHVSFLLSLPPTPLGCHRAPDFCSLSHTANLHCLILHMVMYMFQCYTLNNLIFILRLYKATVYRAKI